jgi:hypothetical protein
MPFTADATGLPAGIDPSLSAPSEVLARRIDDLVASGRPAAAASLVSRLLAVAPSLPALLRRQGVLLRACGDLDGALRWLGRLACLAPGAADDRILLASVAQSAGCPSAAACRAVVALAPGRTDGYGQFALQCLASGDHAAAAAALRRVVRLVPGHPQAVRLLESCRHVRLASERAASGGAPGAPRGVLVYGDLDPVTGYGHMSGRFLRHLEAAGVPVHAQDIYSGHARDIAAAPFRPALALDFLIPPAVRLVPGIANLAFTMVEALAIPPSWKRSSERLDGVIVPCEASRQAWLRQGFAESRLRVCPLGVDAPPPDVTPLALTDRRGRPVASYRTRILNISDFVARKNLDGVLRVWLRCTRADDDAVLILKPGKGKDGAAFAALVAQTERVVGRRLDEAAAVAIVDRRLGEAEMHSLFRAGTHYWSLSHGEGWDLPMTTAATFGLGLIAPDHTAYRDYLHPGLARLIASRPGPARLPCSDEPCPVFFGLEWWEPDEEAAGAILAGIVQGRDAPLPDAGPYLLERFGWDRAGARLLELLREAGL